MFRLNRTFYLIRGYSKRLVAKPYLEGRRPRRPNLHIPKHFYNMVSDS